jgi:hypothetical protein
MNRAKLTAASICVLGFALFALAWGCAKAPLSVGHLKRDAWSLEEPHSLKTDFMRFDYQVLPVGDAAGIQGWAYLDTDKVPAWAKWMESVRFTAYLCDPEGRVIAQDSRTFLPREARSDQGIGFEFTLKPQTWGKRPLYIAFGYRLVLTEDRGVQGGREPFFVSEDAMSR